MPFVRYPGVEGLVFEPEATGPKKHKCPDCFSCQWCDESRCKVCLASKKKSCQTDGTPCKHKAKKHPNA
ncbi:MAG: hypothetical protein EOM20_00435 [Spartobacteria bacterium]|nr:hypothetical protein [Spartobacteria bacterium]